MTFKHLSPAQRNARLKELTALFKTRPEVAEFLLLHREDVLELQRETRTCSTETVPQVNLLTVMAQSVLPPE